MRQISSLLAERKKQQQQLGMPVDDDESDDPKLTLNHQKRLLKLFAEHTAAQREEGFFDLL
jgi:hypothetical protein